MLNSPHQINTTCSQHIYDALRRYVQCTWAHEWCAVSFFFFCIEIELCKTWSKVMKYYTVWSNQIEYAWNKRLTNHRFHTNDLRWIRLELQFCIRIMIICCDWEGISAKKSAKCAQSRCESVKKWIQTLKSVAYICIGNITAVAIDCRSSLMLKSRRNYFIISTVLLFV